MDRSRWDVGVRHERPPAVTKEAARIDIDDPDVDMDDGHRLLYRGVPCTGEVTEHLSGALVSLDDYVGGVLHGLSREWHQDGPLRSQGVVQRGLPRGESQEWHSNGAPARRRVFDRDGLTLREDDAWDGTGQLTRSWRSGTEGRPV
ncbi:toxin-antitoxin system YwqK family antitoxin [Streptomyces griseoluteus]|uniref:toxin-antitoxin system YwqK family antitoxin n=1 Tax=Streptomyces griseoluteus TaxID=29306 RepID=UPI0036FE4A7D